MSMKLYDDSIIKLIKKINDYQVREFETVKVDYPQDTDRSMVLRSDMAFELGGEKYSAIGSTVITADSNIIDKDRIFLLGNDLNEIKKDVPYARIAIVRVKENLIGEGNALYDAIRKIEYTRYHFYPRGFMMRVSSTHQKESVRVSKEAIADKLDFMITGNMMIEAFHKNPLVEAVWLYYITDTDFDYDYISDVCREVENITGTIDHILKNVSMDCSVCNLQEICDEVEGLRELHFKQKEEKEHKNGI